MLLREGSTGSDVGRLHQELLEVGLTISRDEMVGKKFGSSTKDALIKYQAAQGLTPDGVCGPKTWAALADGDAESDGPLGWRLDPINARIKPVIDRAVSLIGLRESPPGSNRSAVIDSLNEAASIPLGSPWCAAFATGMYSACPENPFKRPLGSAYKVREWGNKSGRLVSPTSQMQPGDIFVTMRTGSKGHVGIIVADLGDKVATIEGNAGNAVKKLVRNKSDFDAIVRPLAPLVA